MPLDLKRIRRRLHLKVASVSCPMDAVHYTARQNQLLTHLPFSCAVRVIEAEYFYVRGVSAVIFRPRQDNFT